MTLYYINILLCIIVKTLRSFNIVYVGEACNLVLD